MWYTQNGLVTEAITVAERLVKLTPDEPSYCTALARLYQQARRYEDARKALEKARKTSRKAVPDQDPHKTLKRLSGPG